MSQTKTNITLSKTETENLKSSYTNANKLYNAGLNSQPITQMSMGDELHDNNYKFIHILLFAGIT